MSLWSMSLDLTNRRLHGLAKEGTWIIVGQVAVVLGSLALVRVLTELLTSAEYGQLALGLTLVTLFSQVVFGGISAGIGRHYAIAAEKRDLHAYLAGSRMLLLRGTVIAVCIGLLVALGTNYFGHSQWIGIALAATLLAVFGGYNSTLNGIQNAARQRAIVAMHSGLDAWLKIGLAVGLLLWLGTSSVAVILGFAASAFLVTLSQLLFLRRTIKPLPPSSPAPKAGDWPSKIWIYSWPFSTWGVFTWMQQVSDRWALGLFGTTQEVGFYAVVFQLGYTPIALLLGLSITFLAPILFHRAGDATSAERNQNVHLIIWRITITALIGTGLAVLATSVLHEWLFMLLVAPEFRWVSYLLPWIILAGGIFAAGQMLSLKLMSEMKARELLAPKIATAIVGIGLNVAGAAVAGVDGVVTAMVVFSVIYLAWMILLARSSGFLATQLGDSEV
jgi:O-antigen/teichoic acid export membrane protein